MDTETGLYYLMSRYYDPVTHRFVNADGCFNSGTEIDLLSTNMYAYCINNPLNNMDPTGKFALSLGGLIATLITVTVVVVVTVVALNIASNPSVQQGVSNVVSNIADSISNSISQANEKEKDYAPNIPPTQPQSQAIFTHNPYDFQPKGLVMHEYPGTKNGRIIQWKDPVNNIAIFEWDEDYKYGPHYHILLNGKHIGDHHKPNTPVPEPWDTIYFGG